MPFRVTIGQCRKNLHNCVENSQLRDWVELFSTISRHFREIICYVLGCFLALPFIVHSYLFATLNWSTVWGHGLTYRRQVSNETRSDCLAITCILCLSGFFRNRKSFGFQLRRSPASTSIQSYFVQTLISALIRATRSR